MLLAVHEFSSARNDDDDDDDDQVSLAVHELSSTLPSLQGVATFSDVLFLFALALRAQCLHWQSANCLNWQPSG